MKLYHWFLSKISTQIKVKEQSKRQKSKSKIKVNCQGSDEAGIIKEDSEEKEKKRKEKTHKETKVLKQCGEIMNRESVIR